MLSILEEKQKQNETKKNKNDRKDEGADKTQKQN